MDSRRGAPEEQIFIGSQTLCLDQLRSPLADAYSLASFTADKLGDYGLSWVLADRARGYAHASGHPVTVAAATREAAVAMRRAGHHADAVDLLVTTASGLPDDTGRGLAGQGCLWVTAAYTAAQRGAGDTAVDLIRQAAAVAAHLPDDWPADGIFTRTQVRIYEVAVHNTLGNHARALTAARTIPLATCRTRNAARGCAWT